jgi:hypothetical protein
VKETRHKEIYTATLYENQEKARLLSSEKGEE